VPPRPRLWATHRFSGAELTLHSWFVNAGSKGGTNRYVPGFISAWRLGLKQRQGWLCGADSGSLSLERVWHILSVMSTRSRITIRTLQARKAQASTGSEVGDRKGDAGGKIAMLTCYDYSTAKIMEEAGIDSLLVGDTYGEVCLGYDSTLPMTLDHLVTVAAGVRRGAPSVFLVGDMPFLSYQVNTDEAIRNGGRFMAEAGCDCVKIEVDRRLVRTVEAMTAASIPVMAHLGLRPQSIRQVGGYVAQGKASEDALRIIEDAKMMEDAGAVALLLEAVPMEVAGLITESTHLPVIGCVSGPLCDGQVVVMHDILGYSAGHPPRSVRQYVQLHDVLAGAFRSYMKDVVEGSFPDFDRSIKMDSRELAQLHRALDAERGCGEDRRGK